MTRLYRPLFCLLLLGSAILLRYPGLNKMVWNLDEGSTFTMAQIVRNGGVLYRDAADNRNPLVPYAKAAILSVVGDWNIRGAHIVLAGMLGLVAVLLWRIGRRGNDERTGILAALYFTVVSFVMLAPLDAMAAHTGWFVILFSALGMWLFLVAMERASGLIASAAGTAFALSFLSKQPGLFDFGVSLVLGALVMIFHPERRAVALKLAVWSVAGFVWPLVVTIGYFAYHHALADAIYYAWTYNTTLYVPEVPRLERLLAVKVPFLQAGWHVPFALVLGVAGAVALLLRVGRGLRRRPVDLPILPWMILGWSAAGLVSTMLSGRNFAHYSIQVMPGLCLACGWVTARSWEISSAWLASGRRGAAWAVRLLLVLGGLSLAGTAVYRAATFDTRDGEVEDVGRFVHDNTAPTDRIFIWGYFPEIHVFAQRLPSTRFIYTVFLNGLIPWTNLAPDRNTDYAVVPGSWDAFWHDFNAHPPTLIVDTRSNRGYLKYPLSAQAKLWSIVQNEFAEVQPDYFESRGFPIYKRLSGVTPSPWPENAAVVANLVRIVGPAVSLAHGVRLQVNAPDNTDSVELYHNGQLYRRIAVSPSRDAQVTFWVSDADLTTGLHHFQAIARNRAGPLASAPHDLKIQTEADAIDAGGPPIKFDGGEVHAIESRNPRGEPIRFTDLPPRWDAHTPSKLVYRRTPDMHSLTFSFGIMPGAYDGSYPQKTDGYEVQVNFADDNGQVTNLFKRIYDPTNNGRDKMIQTETVVLPSGRPGRIVLTMDPGKLNDPAYDWTFWKSLSAERTPLRIEFRGQPVFPLALDAPLGVSEMGMGRRQVVMIHMPAQAEFPLRAGMNELAGEFGMLDQTWKNEQKTAGAVFEIIHVRADGQLATLFSRTIDPAGNARDRGLQFFRIKLPSPAEGRLRFVTRPLHPPNNSFGYTYWHHLVAGDFIATLRFEEREINSLASEAKNGFSLQTEDGQPVLLAHAPSNLVFPIEPEARRLSGAFGLMHGAYTGQGTADGATFIVEFEDAAGTRTELLRRFLNPRDIAADRGAIPFSVDLPAGEDGRVTLRTDAAPSGNLSFAWSFWKDLQYLRINAPTAPTPP